MSANEVVSLSPRKTGEVRAGSAPPSFLASSPTWPRASRVSRVTFRHSSKSNQRRKEGSGSGPREGKREYAQRRGERREERGREGEREAPQVTLLPIWSFPSHRPPRPPEEMDRCIVPRDRISLDVAPNNSFHSAASPLLSLPSYLPPSLPWRTSV